MGYSTLDIAGIEMGLMAPRQYNIIPANVEVC
jgi:hypothetical protein